MLLVSLRGYIDSSQLERKSVYQVQAMSMRVLLIVALILAPNLSHARRRINALPQ